MAASENRPRIPKPAHPRKRQKPLPGHRPKPSSEDAEAPAKLERILSSPSYRLVEEDEVFLSDDEARGVRLQLEYLKPQVLLERHGIEHTVVVFGSTRIADPASAEERVETLRRELAERPDDAELQVQLARAERAAAKSRYYQVARDLGRLVAESGEGPGDCRLVVMTGGGPGVMEAANRGAHEAGAETVGLNIELPREQYPNPYVTPELCFRFRYFALRKMHFLLRARALVALPGGFGTLDELLDTLTLVQTRKIPPLPIVLVGEEYWRRVLDVDFLADEGMIDAEDRELFWYAETAEEVWQGILAWYVANGQPLLGDG
jgi:uncharacterized protein (TIGR00730 family)